ncbi:MAG: alkaline phosphatase family protein [Acidobacteriota bacterium]|nr:alkaline phosphatase family protein [Acidobacteriota bacterium]
MKILRRPHFVVVLFAFALGAAVLSGQTPAPKPSLVVVISVDQMRADYLDRFRPWFGKDGFNRFLERGAVYPEARHRHATTFTCPGHASIGTGLDPKHSGIIANRWYDPESAQAVYCVEDRRSAWVGEGPNAPRIPIQPASPVRLNADSLGDRLKEKYPQARVVGVALKDRAAVLMAGRKADAAIWFEERFARFVTSTYYPPRPSLLAYDAGLPAFFQDPSHGRWELSGRIPERDLARITFDPPELSGAKGQPAAFGATFPHALATPYDVVHSPWGDELVLGLTRSIVLDLGLGRTPDRPDLLFVGLSSMDYYGHWFGPDSREIADGVVRLDASLEQFFTWLDEKVGRERVLIFLTADHGVQAIPEVARARQKAKTGRDDPAFAGRVDLSNGRGGGEFPAVRQLSADRIALEEHLAKKFGYALDPEQPALREAAVVFFEEPSLSLNRTLLGRRGLDVETVKNAVREWVRVRPGVEAAYTNTEIGDGLPATAPHALAIARSFQADRSGDVTVILKPGWMWSYGNAKGTTHGQPNDDDTRVPLLAWGAGVRQGVWSGRVSPLSIARTVGALFGFEAGEPDSDVLEPVLGRAPGVKRLMEKPPKD